MDARHRKSGRKAAVVVLVAICLVPIIIVMAYVLDGGMLMSQRRHAQAVADATAHAGACLLAKSFATDSGLDPQGKARAAALSIAAENGYANDGTRTTVVVNIPPTSGAHAGMPGNVEALVTYYQPRYFSSILGSGAIPVRARSVGRVVVDSPLSILVTDPSSAPSFSLTGSARLTVGGKVHVNSNRSQAVNASNGAYVKADGGTYIVGKYLIPNWAGTDVFFSKAPLVDQPSMVDPYASIPQPSTSGLTTRGAPDPPYGSATLEPGVYNGGLTLGGGMTITMKPGLYYMKGGNFTVANGVNLTGTGVTIYTDTGSLNFQGGTTVKLNPPAGGTYKGISYFQARTNASSLNNIANGSNVNISGAVYAPAAPLSIAGGAAGSSYGSQLIVRSLAMSNGVNVTINAPEASNAISFLNIAE